MTVDVTAEVLLTPVRNSRRHRAIKSALDRTAAAIGLVAASPLLMVIAAAIRRDSPGPVLYCQERIGYGGEPFRMYKFRTMTADAETQLLTVLASEGMVLGPLYKVKRDPRVTRVGAVLRRLSLDELPQLWNVVRGDMSLVGPRPQVAAEVDTYSTEMCRRLLVKPGMTGLWQVNGRSDLPWEEAVRLDLHYVDHWSLRLDWQILRRTPSAVRRSAGAY
ncbi:sugar transferase [Knoellia sp. p5-6-4]|uniref:sugar transferase n=1 Tax=unclassified Knoellia TaxID=2618719 RepID=UPI0023DB8B07|nr:sugar transferase [Knoellia sp. p5-6-4]MDF2144477.1 sugar transferase [Knoellia sp. p5-6-4]